MRFTELLARADEEVLQQLVGKPTVRLLNLIDSRLASTASLRELITALRTPEDLLRDPAARTPLLELLPTSVATELANDLGLKSSKPFDALRTLQLTKGSAREARLFSALGVVPVVAEEIPTRPASNTISGSYPLFSHQRLAARRAEAVLDASPHRVMLHMPTGSGKTRTAMHIAARQLLRREPNLVTWLAYSEELCEQAAAEFEDAWSHLGDRSITVHRYWGPRDLDVSEVRDGFLVASLGKVYQRAKREIDFLPRIADRTCLVIIDEAHQAVADSYRFTLEILAERNEETGLLGLSATPGRTWNDPDKDRQLSSFFNSAKITLEIDGYDSPVDYLVDNGYLARGTFKTLPYDAKAELTTDLLAQLSQSLDIPEGVLDRLATDEQRNLLILNSTESLARRHDRILVFAATVGHAKLLATILRARGFAADSVTASTPAAERARIIASYKSDGDGPMILCNYGVLTTGFDAPKTSAAVIARPTKSLILYSQMVGRAMRGPKAGGNKTAEILTVVDTSLPGFGEMSEAFKNWEDVW